jgi:hypothetical protein
MRTKLVMMTFVALLEAMVMFAGAASAADISGKWTAQTIASSSGATIEYLFTFNVDGDKVIGTVITQQVTVAVFKPEGQTEMKGKLITPLGSPKKLSEGKISGNNISFVVVDKQGGPEIKFAYSGKISGDEIVLTMETIFPKGFSPPSGPGAPSVQQTVPPQEMIAKRIAP